MAAPAPAFSFHHRRRRSPLSSTFFPPVDLSEGTLVETLASISGELLSLSTPPATTLFQRKNTRSLAAKVRSLLSLFHFIGSSVSRRLPAAAVLCFKELYILFHRSKLLLEYCSQSSRLWLLLRNRQISGHFHDLNVEVSTLLDVFPSSSGILNLSVDLVEQIDLLRRQAKNSALYIDPNDEALRTKMLEFLEKFEKGNEPEKEDLRAAFVDKLGIVDARICRTEIEFLEEQIYNQEEEVDSAVLHGVVALARYARFLLFGFGPDVDFKKFGSSISGRSSPVKGVVLQELGGDDDTESFVAIPRDYVCPVSLDLMKDPVVVSTGQTYDRESILRWIDEGHNTCPKSGQALVHKRLIPNRALRNVISQWCIANSVPYDPPESSDYDGGAAVTSAAKTSKAAVEANKFTTGLLIDLLASGTPMAKTTAAREMRLLAKTARENRAHIAEAGAIPLLRRLLPYQNPVAQENSVTALLNLSIYEKNKSKIMEEEGCLAAIVDVLTNGLTTEARENAAATLFSLSVVHDYKKRIAYEDSAVEGLTNLLRHGTPRGKKDAVMALFNLSTHPDNCNLIVNSDAAAALVDALATEGVAEEAAGALALLGRQKTSAVAVATHHSAIYGLVALMRRGTPKAKENAVAALVEMCRSGGPEVTGNVASAPGIGGLIQTLLSSGSKRARRKAASLAKLFQRREASGEINYGGWAAEFPMLRSRSVRRSRPSAAAAGESSDVSVVVPISVPVP